MIDIINNQKILTHLISNKDFVVSLEKDFTKDEVIEITKYATDINFKYPVVMDRFQDWIECEFENSDTKVLSIAWDSEGSGSGGNGFIRFESVFGILKMTSSDYSDNHITIFNKNDFFPWGIENLMNDYIYLDSDIYTEKELLSLAAIMGMEEHTKLYINDTEIKR